MEEVVWSEKYRPKTINECILPEKIKKMFKSYKRKKDFPNLLLTGGPGVGKTTIAKAMLNEIGAQYITINGSLYRNIDTLRTDVMDFASSVSLTNSRKFVIIDEADGLNAASTQPALRAFMQDYSKNCGFIFTANYPQRIFKELISRFVVIKFSITKDDFAELGKQFLLRIEDILKKEQIKYDRKVVAQVIQKYYPDFRKTLNELQGYSNENDEIDIGILSVKATKEFSELLEFIKNKSFQDTSDWCISNSYIENVDLISWLFENKHLYLKDKNAWPALVLILNEAQKSDALVADKVINNMAMLTEITGKLVT